MIYFINFMTFGIVLAILLDGFQKYINEEEDDLLQHNQEVHAGADALQRVHSVDLSSSDDSVIVHEQVHIIESQEEVELIDEQINHTINSQRNCSF
jgi:hypothetical protein